MSLYAPCQYENKTQKSVICLEKKTRKFKYSVTEKSHSPVCCRWKTCKIDIYASQACGLISNVFYTTLMYLEYHLDMQDFRPDQRKISKYRHTKSVYFLLPLSIVRLCPGSINRYIV